MEDILSEYNLLKKFCSYMKYKFVHLQCINEINYQEEEKNKWRENIDAEDFNAKNSAF